MSIAWDANRRPAATLLDAIGAHAARPAPPHRSRRRGAAGEGRVVRPDRFGEGPDLRAHAREGGGARRSPTGHDDRRVHDRQRRHRVRRRRRDQGLRLRDRDARGHERGAQEDDPRVRGGARVDAGRRNRHRPRDGDDAEDGRGRARTATSSRRSSRTRTTPQAQMASGEEIWEQTGGELDAVVAAQGTGGWISGVARALKAHDPAVRAYAVEPAECPLISEQRWGTHGVPGIGDGIIPPNLDLALMDGIVTASTAEALDMAARLAREEGLLCGPSSGINVVAALKVADTHPEFRRIVTVIADTGQRYLSGELFGERPDVEEPDRDHEIDADTLERWPRTAIVWSSWDEGAMTSYPLSAEDRAIQIARAAVHRRRADPVGGPRRGARGPDPRGRAGAASPPGDRARTVRDEHAEGARRRRDDDAPADARLRAARPRDQRARLVRAHARRRGRPPS